jgi:hypothetical protein
MDTVFIVESPSDKDLLEGRKEGDTLSQALSLSGIKAKYFLVVSRNALRLAFLEIEKEVLASKNPLISLPYIHISAHGNDKGVGLTDGEFLSWADLRDFLLSLNLKIGYVNISHKVRISKIVLCMSVCEGLNIGKICKSNPKPFQAVIGNRAPIYWSDGLTAFLIFYHNAIWKGTSTKMAVQRMNRGSGVDTKFAFQVDPEIL